MPKDLRDRTTQFISKLVELTRDRKIKWTVVTVRRGAEEYTGYETIVEGRRLRIYEYEYSVFVPSDTGFGLGAWTGTSPSGIERKQRKVSLDVLDEFADRAVYSFEGKAGLGDLFEGAAYSASKVDDLINSVLRPG